MIIYLAAIDAPEDRDTFVALYETYRNLMFHVAHKILRNEADAEDAVHDAFVTVAEKIQIFSSLERHKTRSLLVTIVEHKAIDLYRKKQRRGEAPLVEEISGIDPGPQEDASPPGPVHPPPAWAVPGILPAEVRAGLLHPGGRPVDGPVLGRRPKAGAAGQGKTAGTLPGGGDSMTFFTDDRLRQAAQEAGAILDGSLPAPEDCAHTFSLPFQAKMAKLLRRRKRAPARRAMCRVACLVLVCLLGSGVFLTTNAQAREAFFGWVSEQVESARRYFHVGDPLFSEKVVPYEMDVPEGYRLNETLRSEDGEFVYESYVNEDGLYIFFLYQYDTESSSGETVLNEAGSTIKQVEINGNTADLYLSQDPAASNTIIWTDQTTHALIEVTAFLEEDALISLAESVTPIEE